MNPAGLLDHLVATLEQIRGLLPDDSAAWHADARTRLAVERLWITAGNLAEAYRITAGIETGTDPWAELYRFRNLIAHALPGDLSPQRVWAESVADLEQVLEQVRARQR